MVSDSCQCIDLYRMRNLDFLLRSVSVGHESCFSIKVTDLSLS